MRVLLIEDDAVLGEAVRDHVAAAGHAVDWTMTVEDARAAVSAVDYGLVLLDLRLPDGRGIDFLRGMRASGSAVPVIILTAFDQISDRIEGLNSGADDYLVKPFDLDELTARMRAVARRHAGRPASSVEIGPLSIDAARRLVTLSGKPVPLSSREWAVLDVLSARPQAIVSKGKIEEALYAFGAEVESNTVEVYVSRLRKKLGKDMVETIRGIGYRLGGE
ncbi:response regulator transcription factor [Pseudomonas sp. R2.Fl]|nr:response regulator transcription factor [Pseudomonas sp. R2.Fl]